VRAGQLDRLVQVRRATMTDDGFGQKEVFADHGQPIWAQKRDASDSERFRAGEVAAQITTRFVMRWSAFTADISPRDELRCEGRDYNITGIKELQGRRRWLEITAAARAD
jgi:SPP1 family predicted phage head-tail adaptor